MTADGCEEAKESIRICDGVYQPSTGPIIVDPGDHNPFPLLRMLQVEKPLIKGDSPAQSGFALEYLDLPYKVFTQIIILAV
ncbi:unnamed protein product [Caretta caretta]